jgi:hypothetical protein
MRESIVITATATATATTAARNKNLNPTELHSMTTYTRDQDVNLSSQLHVNHKVALPRHDVSNISYVMREAYEVRRRRYDVCRVNFIPTDGGASLAEGFHVLSLLQPVSLFMGLCALFRRCVGDLPSQECQLFQTDISSICIMRVVSLAYIHIPFVHTGDMTHETPGFLYFILCLLFLCICYRKRFVMSNGSVFRMHRPISSSAKRNIRMHTLRLAILQVSERQTVFILLVWLRFGSIFWEESPEMFQRIPDTCGL